MNKVSVGIAFLAVIFLGNAISEDSSRGDDPAQYNGANQMLLAGGSGGNPWAIPEPKQQGETLPSYITDPKYATDEDLETKLNHGNQQRGGGNNPAQQQIRPGYGAPLGLPAVPNVYTPYTGVPYGYQPGYPMYPGMGVPYMGNGTGFGGNPLLTPYGNLYGSESPYQQTQPPSND